MKIDILLLYVITYFGLFTSMYFLLTLIENRKNIYRDHPSKWPTVTVIVPAYNEEKTVGKTVKSLLALDYPKDKLEIIVVDDGSKDDTFNIASKYQSDIVKVFSKKNGGKGSAMNYGIKKAQGEFVGALDADSFVDKEALKNIISFFTEKSIVAVTPSLKVYKPQKVLQKIQYIEYLVGVFLRKVFALMDCIHVTPGPFTIFRKSFFDKYGGYDENNITEDIEIALRIQSNHLQIENSIDASVYTVAPEKFRELMNQRVRWYCGFMRNIHTYKHLFKPQYGSLGMFVLPTAFLSVILVIVALIYTAYTFVRNFYGTLINLIAIRFDFIKMLTLNFDLFYADYGTIFIFGAISLVLGVTIVLLAKSLAEEKDVKIRYLYVFYLLIYWLLYGWWWIVSIYFFFTKREVGWHHKSEN